MKKLLLSMALAGAALIASPIQAQAAATTEVVPFNAEFLLCNGDPIQISGSLLAVFTETTTPSGGFVFSSHFSPQGVTGVDTVTGTTFHATGLTRDITITSPPGGFTETFVNRFHIQATNGEQSYIVSEILHVTINANGDLTASVDNFSATC